MANETQLAVILHADVVRSTGLVRADERLAHERIQATFRAFSELIAKHRGVPHEVRGDALVAEFSRPSDAVLAALEFQDANAKRNRALPDALQPFVRIGIAIGEVVIADGTVTGTGVVLVQRLEQVAPSGRICVSAAIREALAGRVGVRFEELGLQQLKGFDAPQSICLIDAAGEQEEPFEQSSAEYSPTARPGVAVLPFESRSAEAEQA